MQCNSPFIVLKHPSFIVFKLSEFANANANIGIFEATGNDKMSARRTEKDPSPGNTGGTGEGEELYVAPCCVLFGRSSLS